MAGRRTPKNINIEKVFVNLRRAWYPPSAAVEKSFTRLTRTLSGIFARLGSDPDLALLHAQIYRDLPGLAVAPSAPPVALPELASAADDAEPDEVRSRKEFYLCSQLIQLMEDVYVDLQLEGEYRHPDNRGWMNLFRHWSRSDTFRVAWAVAAPTYGLRFQAFCERRLGLSLGRSELKSIWDALYSRERPLESPGARDYLDTAERRVVEMLTSPYVQERPNPIARRVRQIVVGRLVVPSTLAAELLATGRRALTVEERADLAELTYGFAALDFEGRLLTVRVRRHLRDQGVGRALMQDLVQRMGVLDTELPTAAEMRAIGLHGGASGQIENLFKSVINEVDLSEHRASERPSSPVFGLLPRLPYSGVVRPAGVTWVHAVGFVYWVLAASDTTISWSERAATAISLRDWAGENVDARELAAAARDAYAWYQNAKRPVSALVPEVMALIDQLRKQPWFAERQEYLRQGLETIQEVDEQVSEEERELVEAVRRRLLFGDPPE